MKWLNFYCKNFGLKIYKDLILSSKGDVIGTIEGNDAKYVSFNQSKQTVKTSDLLLLAMENIPVH